MPESGGAIVNMSSNAGLLPRAHDPVYTITKAFWQGLDKIRADAPWVDNITLDFAVQEGPLPLHPGALKYYDEVGFPVADANR